MTYPRCRTCGEPVEPTEARYGPASSPDGRVAEHWDCHTPVEELCRQLREGFSLHLGPDEVHGDPLPRRTS